MKIPQKLPQFEKEQAFLVVAGKQEARIFLAYKGTITEIASMKLPTPHYSDREGFSMRRGHGGGGISTSGSAYELPKEKIRRDFRRELTHSIKKALEKYSARTAFLYLFLPRIAARKIVEGFPGTLRARIRSTVYGNYLNETSLTLLEMLRTQRRPH